MTHRLAGLLIAAAFLPACIQSTVHSFNTTADDKAATSLTEARMAMLGGKSDLAAAFYEEMLAKAPGSAEAAYFAAAAFVASETKSVREIDLLRDFEPSRVLAGLKKVQPRLELPLRVSSFALDKLSQGLATPFEAFELGARRNLQVFFDRFELFDFAAKLAGDRLLMSVFASINLDSVELLDERLEALRDKVYKLDPECSQPGLPDSQLIHCANKVLAAGLALINDSTDPLIASVFTVRQPELIGRNFAAMRSAVMSRSEAFKARKPLGEGKEYFTSPDVKTRGIDQCLVARCSLGLGDKLIELDLPGFFSGFPADLRRLMPKKFSYPRNLDSPADVLRGLELNDPTFGGLFPNGDLIEKAKSSDDALSLMIYFVLITAWALPAGAS